MTPHHQAFDPELCHFLNDRLPQCRQRFDAPAPASSGLAALLAKVWGPKEDQRTQHHAPASASASLDSVEGESPAPGWLQQHTHE